MRFFFRLLNTLFMVPIFRQVLKNAGFATIFEGFIPFRANTEALAARTADRPLLRIRPTGIGNGAYDPGGWAWVWTVVLTIAVVAIILAVVL